jgi:glycine cleavage system H protein
MDVPDGLRYTREHEWVRREGPEATVGITAHAQDELGDIVYLDLPQVGAEVTQHKTFGVVESVKAVSDLYSPLSGRVVRINEELLKQPELVNHEPYGKGWLIAVELSRLEELEGLLSASDYRAYVQEETKKDSP